MLPSFVQRSRSVLFALATAAATLGAMGSESYYRGRPDDPLAVYLTKDQFAVHADGSGDDAPALQQAIDRVEERTHAGIVFVPEGTYRLARTVHVWQGIRLIGYGEHRPRFVLGRNTPGFQEGAGRYLIHFADNRPAPGGPLVDASEFTFYSGMSNIDIELQDGNPAAIAVRFHVAQHSALSHMSFFVGSARAAMEDIGNQAYDLDVHGGDYGIVTKRTAPVWQFLLMDSSFEGQRVASIHTQDAGMTLVRVRFADVPVAVKIADGQVEQLYGRDLTLERVREAGFVPGNARNPHEEITLTNIACRDVPRFLGGEQPIAAPAPQYVVDHLSLGLDIGADGREAGLSLHHREQGVGALPPVRASDVPSLPPVAEWVNVHTLGAKGDGETDDTAALQAAVERHRVLYFPSGSYRVRESLRLKPDTVLIGLNPGTTHLVLADNSRAFAGKGEPVGLVVAPEGGTNIVSSLAVSTGVGNPRAAGVVWMAGERSLLDDVSFPARVWMPGKPPPWLTAARTKQPAATAHPAAKAAPPQPNFSNTQAVDLLVTHGGGGIFRGNWPHNTNSRLGLRVENTATPGRIYQISVEHHLYVEAEFNRVRNWQVFALQTEEENPAGAEAYSTDIRHCEDLLLANTYLYRVSRNVRPKTDAILVRDSDRIAFENVKDFSQTRLAFDNPVRNEANGAAVRAHFFTRFEADRAAPKVAEAPLPSGVFAAGAKLARLATGFSNASGLAVDGDGNVFFTDAANHRVYRWAASAHGGAGRTASAAKPAEARPALWAEFDRQPMVLGFVPPDHLLAVVYERGVFRLNPREPGRPQPVAETAAPEPDTALLLPTGMHNELSVLRDLLEHRGYVYRRGSNTAIVSVVPDEHRGYFFAPGTSTAVLTGGTWRPYLQSSTLAAFRPGETHPLTSEDDGRTYRATLTAKGQLQTEVFAERGGTSVVSDRAGHVFIAGGQVWVFDSSGRELGALEVPERPGSLAIGGADGRTLFIGARSSLYAIPLAAR